MKAFSPAPVMPLLGLALAALAWVVDAAATPMPPASRMYYVLYPVDGFSLHWKPKYSTNAYSRLCLNVLVLVDLSSHLSFSRVL